MRVLGLGCLKALPRLAPAVLASALLAGLSLTPAVAVASPPLVVAADGVLCDLVNTLAADRATVICLVPPGVDPHQAPLRPRDRQALAEARLVLFNGYGLMPSLGRLGLGSRGIAVAEVAVPASPGRDPHVWHNPAQAAAMVQVVAARLSAVMDPAQRPDLQRRASDARAVLTTLDRWIADQIRTIPEESRVLVSEHRAFGSLARRYGLRELPLLDDFAAGGVVRPAALSAMTTAVKKSGTRQMFAESLPISKALRRVSRGSGVPINPRPLIADGLAKDKSYVQTMGINICIFSNGQGGRCDEQEAQLLARRWSSIR